MIWIHLLIGLVLLFVGRTLFWLLFFRPKP